MLPPARNGIVSKDIPKLSKEQRWLPKLAPLLTLAIPVPLAQGTPGEGYPWHWSVHRWLEGENATLERIADLRETATKLGQFVAVLPQIDPAGGPPSGPHNSSRGVPLAMRDDETVRMRIGPPCFPPLKPPIS